jgi:formyltetrahydrofolate-dependent phosphoribosylglycinamide formyltransferase
VEGSPQEGSVRIAVMVSGHGRGSNMQAIIDACRNGTADATVSLVLGVREEAPAMARAREQGIATLVVRPHGDGAAYAAQLLEALEAQSIGLICLAGYMRLLPEEVVRAYRGRILNVHPALLPLFGGKGMFGEHVHRAVLESGMKVSGCTVHMVDEVYDHGPIVLQRTVPVEEDDTAETLAARVLLQEHAAYAHAVALFAAGRLALSGGRVRIEPERTMEPGG